MSNLTKTLIWAVVGLIYGTAVGIFARRLGYADLSGAILAGMAAAPFILMFFLVLVSGPEMLRAMIAGGLAGMAGFAAVGYVGSLLTGDPQPSPSALRELAVNGVIFGAVVAVWFKAGGLLFQGNALGLIALLAIAIIGGFLGAAIWLTGRLIGGNYIEVTLARELYTWRLGETLAGIPIGLLTAGLTNRLFPAAAGK